MKAIYSIGAVIALLGLCGLVLIMSAPSQPTSAPTGNAEVQPYTEIVSPSGFVNTDGITLSELVGKKVILVDFMTYSCINCQRTFPYLNAWYTKYKDNGLEIVGIHTPEFAFERDIDNVRSAMTEFDIEYPVVLDNEYATWRAYGNRYWPRKYLIDISGNVVYDHIGEGAYEETEMKIRELLEERAQVLRDETDIDEVLASNSVAATAGSAQSPETYFGAARNEYLGNGEKGVTGVQLFQSPATPKKNALYFDGTWELFSEHAVSVSEAGIVYRYEAGDVYLVADADIETDVEVWQDGVRVDGARGADVTSEGIMTIRESRLYKVIHNPEPGEHTLELRVRGQGVRIYAFTFG